MRNIKKKNLPVSKIRRFLEPGPIVLVSSHHGGRSNIMAMGWHTVMEFEPSRVGCFITAANYSYEMVKRSKECVINIPEFRLIHETVGIGNCSGSEVDKFEKFSLTAVPAKKVAAPLIAECFASFECKVVDTGLLRKYNFFILEVVHAHVAVSPKYPKTFHYRGDGTFMVSGRNISLRKEFKKINL